MVDIANCCSRGGRHLLRRWRFYFANIVINTPTRSLDEALSESDWGSEAALLTDFGLPEPQDVD